MSDAQVLVVGAGPVGLILAIDLARACRRSPPCVTETAAFETAMGATGVPFAVVDVPGSRLRGVYGRDLLLLGPDLHVAWRDDKVPCVPDRVAAVVTGHIVAGI